MKTAIQLILIIILPLIMLTGCKQEPETNTNDQKQPAPKAQFIQIGTGGQTGVYYKVGLAIAQVTQKNKDAYGIRKLTHEESSGSVANVNSLLNGDLQFGIVSADVHFNAFNGNDEWADRANHKKLRAVFSIHPEAVTLVAADDANIKTVKDLKGKRVIIGAPGSGTQVAARLVLANAGIDIDKDIIAEKIKPAAAADKIQDGKVDAFFYVVGHPNGSVLQATTGNRRKVHFVPITDIDTVLKEHPYYSKVIIPKGTYAGATNTQDTATFGVKATLMTTADIPEQIVYGITKEVFENIEKFRSLHPTFANLKKQGMLEGLSATIHPGAEKYYKEANLK